MRLDVWLWRARFFKSRSLAAGVVEGGVFVERGGQSRRIDKAAAIIEPGDGVSFRKGKVLRTVRVLGCGVRRGPPAEARALYEDLAAEGEEDAGDDSAGGA